MSKKHGTKPVMTASVIMNIYKNIKTFFVNSLLNPIRKLGMKTKWMILTFLFIVALSYALVSFFLSYGRRDLEKDLKTWGTSLIENLAFSAQEAVIDTNYEKLNHYLTGIMNHRDMIYGAIFDEQGSLIAFQNTEYLFNLNLIETGLRQRSLKITTHQAPNGEYFYNFVMPMRYISVSLPQDTSSAHFDPLEKAIAEIKRRAAVPHHQIIGTIFLGISHANMNEKLVKMRNRAIYISVVSALIFFVFVYWSVDRITTPIKHLDRAAHKIANGDLSISVESDRLDELGRLAESFNEMIAKLNESQEKIKNYTQDLEKQVAERTRELQLSEQHYRALFDHAGLAIALVDNHKMLLMANESFEHLSQYLRRELEGKKYLTDFLAPEDAKEIRSLPADDTPDKPIFPFNRECQFIDRSGNRRNINLTLNSIPGTSNLLASIVDVTEFRELQKKLGRAEHLAAIGELSASIAHEIRNPLVAINTSAGILKSDLRLTGEDAELMSIISEESMRLNKFVDDFLKYARPNEPQLIETNVNTLLRETLLLMKTRMNGIQTQVELSPDLPIGYADPDQLKQVFMNLFINAIEAMPGGGSLFISTDAVPSKNGFHILTIKVKDTGQGIDQADFKKIFQPFYSTKADGVGMGLAVCERIVQNHNGEISVESNKGKGTQFTITLNLKAKGQGNGVYSVS